MHFHQAGMQNLIQKLQSSHFLSLVQLACDIRVQLESESTLASKAEILTDILTIHASKIIRTKACRSHPGQQMDRIF